MRNVGPTIDAGGQLVNALPATAVTPTDNSPGGFAYLAGATWAGAPLTTAVSLAILRMWTVRYASFLNASSAAGQLITTNASGSAEVNAVAEITVVGTGAARRFQGVGPALGATDAVVLSQMDQFAPRFSVATLPSVAFENSWSFEESDEGWICSGGTLTRETTAPKYGAGNIKGVTGAGWYGQGPESPVHASLPSTAYTYSAWIKAPSGVPIYPKAGSYASVGGAWISEDVVGSAVYGTGAWQYVTLTHTTAATAGAAYLQFLTGSSTAGIVIEVDAVVRVLGSTAVAYGASGTPVDGQIVRLQTTAMAALGISWTFRYNADGAAYKWESVGGPAWMAEVVTSQTTTSTSYADLATAGPQITVPLSGDYVIEYGATMGNTSATTYHTSIKFSAAEAADADSAQLQQASTTAVSASVSRKVVKTVAAGTVVKHRYKTAAGTATIQKRWLSITPVRLG